MKPHHTTATAGQSAPRRAVAAPTAPGSEERAHQLAASIHHGQCDALGRPMYDHVCGVAALARDRLGQPGAMVALLHDAIEKGGATREILLANGFESSLIDLVELLTQAPDESAEEYLARCATDPTAAVVKELDLIEKIGAARRIEEEARRCQASWESRLELFFRAMAQNALAAP